MPFVNVKLIKNQVSPEKKKELIEGLTDLIVNIMGRERKFTVITVDELNADQWAIGGSTLDQPQEKINVVTFVNIKVSNGTTNPEEMANMIKAIKDLMVGIFGNYNEANYVIIDELNPDAWGFDGMSMSQRRMLQ